MIGVFVCAVPSRCPTTGHPRPAFGPGPISAVMAAASQVSLMASPSRDPGDGSMSLLVLPSLDRAAATSTRLPEIDREAEERLRAERLSGPPRRLVHRQSRRTLPVRPPALLLPEAGRPGDRLGRGGRTSRCQPDRSRRTDEPGRDWPEKRWPGSRSSRRATTTITPWGGWSSPITQQMNGVSNDVSS